MTSTFEEAVARFGKAAKGKLDNPGATGQPEDQLRNPLEGLFGDLARVATSPGPPPAARRRPPRPAPSTPPSPPRSRR